jgi:SAM-dependent methyltransferase
MAQTPSSWSLPVGSRERWPEDYERGRPGWPREILEVVGLPPEATVLDLGAGTGKLTRVLVTACERVLAVEPEDTMRRLLTEHAPEADVFAGTAEEIPLADASVDAVFVAEAFHKFDHEPALAEIARVLQAHGTFVLLWNIPGGPWEPPLGAAEQLLTEQGPKPHEVDYDPLDLDGPNYWTGRWRAALAESQFAPLQEAHLPNPQTVDREGLVTFFASMGWLGDMPDAVRLPLLDQVRSLLAHDEYRRLWETHVHWTSIPAS